MKRQFLRSIEIIIIAVGTNHVLVVLSYFLRHNFLLQWNEIFKLPSKKKHSFISTKIAMSIKNRLREWHVCIILLNNKIYQINEYAVSRESPPIKFVTKFIYTRASM